MVELVIGNNSAGVVAVLNMITLVVVVVVVLFGMLNRHSSLSGVNISNKAVQVFEVGAFSWGAVFGGVAHIGDGFVWSSDLLALLWMMSLVVHGDISGNSGTVFIMGASIFACPSVVEFRVGLVVVDGGENSGHMKI